MRCLKRHLVLLGLGLMFVAFLLPALTLAQLRTVYVIPSSHWDRGFLKDPEAMLPMLKPHIDEMLDHAAVDPEYRWTIESIWQLNEWLKRTEDPTRIQQLRDLVKRGQVELSGVYGGMHSEFMGPEELNLLTQDGFRMARTLGVDIPELVMTDDVPGYTERFPQMLVGSHVRYLLIGANTPFGGGTSLAPGQVPFFWEGADGSRVLTWVSEGNSGGYTEGMSEYYVAPTTPDPYDVFLPERRKVRSMQEIYSTDNIMLPEKLRGKPPLEVMEIGMKRLAETYGKAGYKYDAVLVMYVHDFISASVERDHLLPMVRLWNASGRQPQLRVATPREFFTYILSKYGPEIPTYKGDWSGLWTDVKTNSPGISAMAREVQEALRASSLLWGGLRLQFGLTIPSGNLHEDYRRLWNYDEHSGSGQVGWPTFMTVQQINDQNREYVEYVRDAAANQRFILNLGLVRALEQGAAKAAAKTAPSTAPRLGVFLPLSWKAVSTFTVPKTPEFENAAALRDVASGATFPIQWSDAGGVTAVPLPPNGIAVFEPAGGAASKPAGTPGGRALENRFYRLELRASDGAVTHLVDRESGKELVNGGAGAGFNQLIRVAGFDLAPMPEGAVSFRTVRGPVFDALEATRSSSAQAVTEYRLYHALKRLEIRNLLDRARMPIVTHADRPNSYLFSFPILPGASIETLQYENGNGLTTFPQGYLPGARLDAVVSHGLAFAAGDLHLALSSAQTFFWHLRKGAADKWKLHDNQVLAVAGRKQEGAISQDYGNYLVPTVEPGLPDRQWFVYVITSWSGASGNGEAYRKIWESVTPAVVAVTRWAGASFGPPASFFETDQPDVVVMAAAPSLTKEGAVVLRLQETGGAPHRVRVSLPAEGLEATQVDLTETPADSGKLAMKGNAFEVDVGTNATVSVLLTKPKK
jgi:hypothetical protein